MYSQTSCSSCDSAYMAPQAIACSACTLAATRRSLFACSRCVCALQQQCHVWPGLDLQCMTGCRKYQYLTQCHLLRQARPTSAWKRWQWYKVHRRAIHSAHLRGRYPKSGGHGYMSSLCHCVYSDTECPPASRCVLHGSNCASSYRSACVHTTQVSRQTNQAFELVDAALQRP